MKRLSCQQLLPDPYLDPLPFMQAAGVSAGLTWAVSTWSGAADRATYLPQVFPVRCTLYALSFMGGNTTGNYDLGVYSADGVKLASTGSTALAASMQTLTLPEIAVPAGGLLYAALALSSTSGSSGRAGFTSAFQTINAGMLQEASALPLPANMTPVISAETEIPIFAWGVR